MWTNTCMLHMAWHSLLAKPDKLCQSLSHSNMLCGLKQSAFITFSCGQTPVCPMWPDTACWQNLTYFGSLCHILSMLYVAWNSLPLFYSHVDKHRHVLSHMAWHSLLAKPHTLSVSVTFLACMWPETVYRYVIIFTSGQTLAYPVWHNTVC